MKTYTILMDKTENNYCGTCKEIEGIVIAHDGSLEEFKKYSYESMDFYFDCAIKDGEITEKEEYELKFEIVDSDDEK